MDRVARESGGAHIDAQTRRPQNPRQNRLLREVVDEEVVDEKDGRYRENRTVRLDAFAK